MRLPATTRTAKQALLFSVRVLLGAVVWIARTSAPAARGVGPEIMTTAELRVAVQDAGAASPRAAPRETATVPDAANSAKVPPEVGAKGSVKVRRRGGDEPKAPVALAGRIVAAGSSAPLEDVEIHIARAGGRNRVRRGQAKLQRVPNLGEPSDAVTDRLGRFELDVPATGAVWVTCVGAGWSTHEALLRREDGTVPDEVLETSTAVPEVVVELEREPRISGRVEGDFAGTFARATFAEGSLQRGDRGRVTLVSLGLFADQYIQAPVSDSGDFQLCGLPTRTPLTFSLVSSADEAAELVHLEQTPVSLEPEELHELQWLVADRGSIVCTVRRPDGAPVPGVELWLITDAEARGSVFRETVRPAAKVVTDEVGRGVLRNVLPGEWAVALAPADRRGQRADEFARYALPCTVRPGEESAPLEFEWRDDLFIEGVVVCHGAEIVDAMVLARTPHSVVPTLALAKDSSRFKVGPLRSGEHTLQVRLRHERGWHPLVEPLADRVEAGTTGIELAVHTGARLRVKTFDAATGAPLPARSSVRSRAGGSECDSVEARTDTLFPHLAPGSTTVTATDALERVGVAQVELVSDRENELVVGLEYGSVLEVCNTDALREASVTVERNGPHEPARTVPPRETVSSILAPGKCIVHVRWHGDSTGARDSLEGVARSYEVDLRPGSVRLLDVRP
jgi:hypothetical protein